MKIWKSFGSGHSAHLTVIGTFKTIDSPKKSWKILYMHNGKGVTRMLMPFFRLGKTGFRQ